MKVTLKFDCSFHADELQDKYMPTPLADRQLVITLSQSLNQIPSYKMFQIKIELVYTLV